MRFHADVPIMAFPDRLHLRVACSEPFLVKLGAARRLIPPWRPANSRQFSPSDYPDRSTQLSLDGTNHLISSRPKNSRSACAWLTDSSRGEVASSWRLQVFAY